MLWALILALMATIFLVARESFTGRSSGLSPVRSIICLLGRRLGLRWWAPLPCVTQLLLQLVNLTLHVSFILCMRDMTLPPWLTLTSMCCLHTSFMISPLLKIYDRIITLRIPWFRLVQINITLIIVWCKPDSSISSVKPKSPSDQIKLSSQTAPIVRTSFGLDSKTGLDSGPTSPNNKFVERGRKN